MSSFKKYWKNSISIQIWPPFSVSPMFFFVINPLNFETEAAFKMVAYCIV